MSAHRTSSAAPILATLALLLILFGAYGAGYLWLARYETWDAVDGRPRIIRGYPSQWIATIYRPAAKVEEWITGGETEIYAIDDT